MSTNSGRQTVFGRAAGLTRGVLHSRREAVFDLYNLLIGAFLFASPWLFAFAHQTARVDLRTTGAILVAVSLAALLMFSKWEEWINVLLGLWLIASPWLLGFAHTKAMHVSIGAGAVVAFLAVLELWLIHEAAAPHGADDGDRLTPRQF